MKNDFISWIIFKTHKSKNLNKKVFDDDLKDIFLESPWKVSCERIHMADLKGTEKFKSVL